MIDLTRNLDPIPTPMRFYLPFRFLRDFWGVRRWRVVFVAVASRSASALIAAVRSFVPRISIWRLFTRTRTLRLARFFIHWRSTGPVALINEIITAAVEALAAIVVTRSTSGKPVKYRL